MKRVLWIYGALFTILLMLGACSSGSEVSGNGNLENTESNQAIAPVDTQGIIADWADFVGIDVSEAEASLAEIGLVDSIGKNQALSETEFKAYLRLAFEKDFNLIDQVVALNRANQETAQAFRIYRAVDNPSAVDAAVEKYVDLTRRAQTMRRRAERGLQILGLDPEGSSVSDLIIDEPFAEIRQAFAGVIFRRISDGSRTPTDAFRQTIEQMLVVVSFKVDGKFLSIYSFTATSPEDDTAISQLPSVPSVRGAFMVLPAAENSFFNEIQIPTTPPSVPPSDGWGNQGSRRDQGDYGTWRGRDD